MPGALRMYVCGLTVYDYMHIGHARMLSGVRRGDAAACASAAIALTYVRNITDIDDKIIKRAAENGESIGALTERFIAAMHEDCARSASCRRTSSRAPREYVPQIIAHGGGADRRGATPTSPPTATCIYAVRRFAGYGRLSGKRLEDLRAGERVEVDEAKRDPLDFVLWKRPSPASPPGLRPGARAGPAGTSSARPCPTALLGTHFDIHGGGTGPEVPAPRERDRPVERRHRRRVREPVDAQRLRQRRRREDVEVAGQLLHRARRAQEAAPSGSDALFRPLAATTAVRSTIRIEQLEQADAALDAHVHGAARHAAGATRRGPLQRALPREHGR